LVPIVVGILSAVAASADPIRIVTSGLVYQIPDDGETGAVLRGSGFEISGAGVSATPRASRARSRRSRARRTRSTSARYRLSAAT